MIITLQRILGVSNPILKQFTLPLDNPNKLFLIEDMHIKVSLQDLSHHIEIYIDHNFDRENEFTSTENGQYIRRVLTWQTSTFRPVRYIHQTRGELEVEYFDREYIAEAFSGCTSFPYFLFINDFGIHRNMYRALKAFYLIPACLTYEKRRKLANVFTLTLEPHGASIHDIAKAFSRPIQDLDRGMRLDINGETSQVCAFTMAFLGDMP